MTRWLVLGSAGQLGADLRRVLDERCESRGDHLAAHDRDTCDITDPIAVRTLLQAFRPEVVINAAAWTAVDAAEDPVNAAAVHAINSTGPSILVGAMQQLTPYARLLHVSTDYVFSGARDPDTALPYDEGDLPAPCTVYGKTKLAGESAVLCWDRGTVVRTAWLYGSGGSNFVRTMLQLERTRESLTVVDDQWGQPTWSYDLARQLVELGLLERSVSGVFHGTSAGHTTWYHFARAIFESIGADPDRIRPVTTAEFPRPAPRPTWSVLGHRRWAEVGLHPIRPWQEALKEALTSADMAH